MDPNTQSQQNTPQIDSTVIHLANAIKQQESGGNYKQWGDNNTSFGAYQWQKGTWNSMATKYLGDPHATMSPENQDKVAQSYVAEKKQMGWNPAQIAASWNGGEGVVHGNKWQTMKGTNTKLGVNYDIPAYVNNVMKYYQEYKGQDTSSKQGQQGYQNTPQELSGQQDINNPTFQETGDEGIITGTAKAIGNVPSSLLNLGKGLFGMVEHPLDTVKNIAESIYGTGQLAGDYVNKLVTGQSRPTTPQEQMAQNIGGYIKDRYGGLDEIKKTMIEDPAGFAFDLSTILSGGEGALAKAGEVAGKVGLEGTAGVLSKGAELAGKGAELTNPISAVTKTGGAVVKGAKNVAGKAGDMTSGGISKLGFSKEIAPEQAIENVYNNLKSQAEDKARTSEKYANVKAMAKRMGRDDPAMTIAENPDYHPTIEKGSRLIKTADAERNIKKDISTLTNKRNELISHLDNTLPPVKTENILKAVKDNVNKIDTKNMTVAAKSAKQMVIDELQNFIDNHGGTASRADIEQWKENIANKIKDFSVTDKGVKDQFNEAIRKAGQTILEEDAPVLTKDTGESYNILKQVNKEMAKRYDAQKFLKDSISNKVLKSGGKMTDLIRHSVLSGAGAMVGGGLVGGYVGWKLGDAIGDWIAQNTLSSASDRLALSKYIVKKPSILDEIDAYIKDLPKEEQTKAEKNLQPVLNMPKVQKALEENKMKELPDNM